MSGNELFWCLALLGDEAVVLQRLLRRTKQWVFMYFRFQLCIFHISASESESRQSRIETIINYSYSSFSLRMIISSQINNSRNIRQVHEMNEGCRMQMPKS